MPDLTYFTVEADYSTVVANTDSTSHHDPEDIPITGQVVFAPLVRPGDVILATQAEPRPKGIAISPVTGIIDSDGRLKLRPQPDDGVSDFAPVRLIADSPILELAAPLFYRASFTKLKIYGKAGSISSFVFQAPNSADAVINLIEVSPRPGQLASGIIKIAPGAVRLDDENRLQFSFDGIDIPEPIPLNIEIGEGGTVIGGGVGPTGPPGPPGDRGPEWFFGNGEPVNAINGSRPGDIYLDTSTGMLYRLGDSRYETASGD